MAANRKKEVDAAVADVDFAKNDYQVKLKTSMENYFAASINRNR